jgi:hypothetical protein
MTQKAPSRILQYWPIVRTAAVIAGMLTVLLALVYWGGTARPGPLFVAGVALLSGLILIFGLAIAWIYVGPPPASSAITTNQAELRQTVGVLALISASSFLVGIFWDEMWHRRYGGFGDDFLWPPHLLIYMSITLLLLFAAGALWIVVHGSGGLRARLRSESQISLVGLVAMFLIASLPSDELWHRIYGKDITAWSLPHLMMAGGVSLIALGATSLALASTPIPTRWRGLRALKRVEWLALLLVAVATVLIIQFGTSEWDGVRSLQPEGGVFRDAFWLRPQWLYPVVVVSVALFSSNVALHLLRCAGVATIVALLVLGFRLACLAALGGETHQLAIGYTAHLLLIAPALALDGWYLVRADHADALGTLVGGNIIAALVFLAVSLPIISRMLIYPPVNSYTAPWMSGMSMIMALAAGWTGARFGGWLGALDRPSAVVPVRRRVIVFTFAGCSIVVLVTLSIMLTAKSPASIGLL